MFKICLLSVTLFFVCSFKGRAEEGFCATKSAQEKIQKHLTTNLAKNNESIQNIYFVTFMNAPETEFDIHVVGDVTSGKLTIKYYYMYTLDAEDSDCKVKEVRAFIMDSLK